MSQQDDQAAVLLAFAPDRACAKCLNEQSDVIRHETAEPGSPCWTADPDCRVWQEHLDRRCLSCGYSWCEATADSYPPIDGQQEEDPVSIRKTGSVTGEVTGVEGDEGITKTAAAAWTVEAEAQLEAENAEADELES